jgi:hypothetical protein
LSPSPTAKLGIRAKRNPMTNHEVENRAGGVEETRKGKDRVPEGQGFYAPATPSGGTRPAPKTEPGSGVNPSIPKQA